MQPFDLFDLIEMCESYEMLGFSVQEQITEVMSGQPLALQNRNALKTISHFFNKVSALNINEEITMDAMHWAKRVDDYLKQPEKE